MGKSWSAINSLMVAARPDRPRALKAVLVCCGSDDRYNDDVHYMGGAMMFDNVSWPSSMFGWLALRRTLRWSAMRGRRCGGADRERRFLVQAMGEQPAARRLLEREQRARSFADVGSRCSYLGMAGRLQEPGERGSRG